jgi:hypothetical protein
MADALLLNVWEKKKTFGTLSELWFGGGLGGRGALYEVGALPCILLVVQGAVR